jgi:hypothetical protein
MKKVKISQSTLITIIIVLVIASIVILAFTMPVTKSSEEIAKCIGERSTLYTQLGCHACQTQETLFGTNFQYLNVIDCFYNRYNCFDIQATPTWEINGEFYTGVQSVDKLQELTKC